MNTPTIVATLLIFWLVMGLGFLAKYVTVRKKGKTLYEAWTSYEGLLFISSIAIPLLVLLYRSLMG
jgi:heme/copper-type cytochrome/quinol oxidase subunit 2